MDSRNAKQREFRRPPGGVPFPIRRCLFPAPVPRSPGGGEAGGGEGVVLRITPTPTTTDLPSNRSAAYNRSLNAYTENHHVIGGKRDVTSAAIWVNSSKERSAGSLLDHLRWKKTCRYF